MRKNKLTIEKFRIATFKNTHSIKGGTGDDSDGGLTTDTVGSEDTTYTTDPNEPCPPSGETVTNDTTAGNNSVPTFGTRIEP